MNKEFRVVARKRLPAEEAIRAYERTDAHEWSEWEPVRTPSSPGGRYASKVSAERAIRQLNGPYRRFEVEHKIQSRPLTDDWTDV